MKRLIAAYKNSMRALVHLSRNEAAVRLELGLLIGCIPMAFLIAISLAMALMLIGSVAVLLLVEILNTAIEATCDAVSTEFNENVRIAKDAGSLAVLLASLLVCRFSRSCKH